MLLNDMIPTTDYKRLNKLLLIRDIQNIAKRYFDDDRSYRWIWKHKINDVYHISYITFMNYISTSSVTTKINAILAAKQVVKHFV